MADPTTISSIKLTFSRPRDNTNIPFNAQNFRKNSTRYPRKNRNQIYHAHHHKSISKTSSQQVRRKYLEVIGITNPDNSGKSESQSIITLITSDKKSSLNNQAAPVVQQEPLKYDKSEEKFNDEKSKESRRKRFITFDDRVAVVPIPMRYEYSQRTRLRLWSGAAELRENAVRNIAEFTADGWDWRSVTEDENMCVCTLTGELIHPIHVNKIELNSL